MELNGELSYGNVAYDLRQRTKRWHWFDSPLRNCEILLYYMQGKNSPKPAAITIMYFQSREKCGSWRASQKKMPKRRKSGKRNLQKTGKRLSASVMFPFIPHGVDLAQICYNFSFQPCQFWVPASSCSWCWSIRPPGQKPSPWTRRCEWRIVILDLLIIMGGEGGWKSIIVMKHSLSCHCNAMVYVWNSDHRSPRPPSAMFVVVYIFIKWFY